MAKPLSKMSREELKEEMSIAGDPKKLIKIFDLMLDSAVLVDPTNPAELINLELALKRVQAEVKRWKRLYSKRTGQQI